jgi:putative glutamine amidotransferase
MSKPIIGLSVDSSTASYYSDYPWYALRENYCDSIHQAGGIPILIPQNKDLIDDYLSLISGIIITGGNFDHDPKMYGEDYVHPSTELNAKRSAFDYALTKQALERQIPFLGICAGHQMLNIVRGGTLIQSIADEVPHALNHSQEECRHRPTHDIDLTQGSLVWECNGGHKKAAVNTSHHQSIKVVGQNLIVTARSNDGIIEAVEDSTRPFCLGVQWHPEFLVCALDRAIYKKMITVCQK